MNYLLCLITFIAGACSLHAQTPTAVLNGQTYFVYPYQESVEFNSRYFYSDVKMEEVHRRDSLNRSVVASEIVPIGFTREFPKSMQKSKKLIKRLRSEYPGVLVRVDFPLNRDITPTLEPLPDGAYVQFYRDFPYVDKNNVLRYRNDVPCAFFHLKANKLDGFACWLSPVGDTLKAGNYTAGLKEGPWFQNEFETVSPTTLIGKKTPDFDRFVDHTYTDTTFFRVVFKNGLMEGPCEQGYNTFLRSKGYYRNNKPSGEWFEYNYVYRVVDKKTPPKRESYVAKHYFLPTEEQLKTPVKGRIIRGEIVDRNRFEHSKELLLSHYQGRFTEFYQLYVPNNSAVSEEGLELPEEKNHSYPGEDDEAYGYNSYYGFEEEDVNHIDFRYERPDRMYYVGGKFYTRNGLLDSLGYVAAYANVYEEYYYNGQLKMRIRIEDGRITEPDTIYWSNGKPANVLTYHPETQSWKEEVFDMNRVPLYVNEYDSLGTLTTELEEEHFGEVSLINGKRYYRYPYSNFYLYDDTEDSLYQQFSTKQTLYEALWPRDSSVAASKTFDPVTRVLEDKHYALNKDLIYHLNCEFSEDYSSVTAKETCASGTLRTETILSGSYQPRYYRYFGRISEEDTILTDRVDGWKQQYQLSSDFTLFQNNQPFTGKFTLTSHVPEFDLKVLPNAIHLDYATGQKHEKAFEKANKKYWKNGKVTKEAHFMSLPTYYREEVSSLVLNVLPFAGQLFTPVRDRHFLKVDRYDYRDQKVKKLSEQQAPAFDKRIEGQFLNGKPEGEWKTLDQFGNPSVVMHFKNGQLNGPVAYYNTVYPPAEDELAYLLRYSHNELLEGPVPTEKKHYLSKLVHYKNGLLDGSSYEITWYGDTTERMHYVEGLPEGDAQFKSPISLTQLRFEDGVPDGIMRSYLTLPDKAPVLLFDLNYQNGQLQGESRSYHMNGKLAKHGFFLSGQPIDDFEAFDTLGFKYQYVKFLYNQPVEEKIWEENQLSVRYEFDWKDSVPFNAEAITETSGLERLLYEISGTGRSRPYYGRPSTLDKTGVNYTMTKYYPNDSVARHGMIKAGKKVGFWECYSYSGHKLYEVQYFDSILHINDTVRFKSKGILTLLDSAGVPVCRSYVVEKVEKYDCSHTDHHEVRMLYTFWERDSSQHRINGYVKNYYDNGVLMNEGQMHNGLATGVWKFYDPYGSLNMVGEYVLGKRNGRWLSGDLSQVKYMGDICLNPNLPNLDEILSYQEKLLDISVIYYQMTKVISREYYGVNMNPDGPPEGFEEEFYFDDYYYDEE